MIQGDFRVFVGSKTVRFSCRDSRLVVESLGGAVREHATCREPGEELASMLAQGARELLERLEPGAHRQGRPARQEPFGAQPGMVGPEVQELFLEQAGTHRSQVDLEQRAEASALVAGEVLLALEEGASVSW